MAQRELPVRTVFYADHRAREHVRTIAAGKPLRATMNAVGHMRKNRYGALLAEVYGEHNGKLYAVVKNDLHGNTHILYQAKLTKEELE